MPAGGNGGRYSHTEGETAKGTVFLETTHSAWVRGFSLCGSMYATQSRWIRRARAMARD